MDENKLTEDPFVTDANKAVTFKLIRKVADIETDSGAFEPDMSHQIFGQAEKIYGFKDLSIKLYFTASSLSPYLEINYSEKVTGTGQTSEPDDIEAILVEKLEITFEKNLDVYVKKIDEDQTFRPMGQLEATFNVQFDGVDRKFEIYQCDVNTSGFKSFHQRLQTFLLWFVDAASFIDFDDSRWSFLVLYEKAKVDDREVYYVVGYVSIYEYYAYPENIRPRISQVLVFPPFQGRGLGSKLIESAYSYYRKISAVKDITMEDASQDLQAVRDYVDCKTIRNLFPHIEKLSRRPNRKEVDDVISKLKLNRRQILRASEILRMSHVFNDKTKYENLKKELKNRLHHPLKVGHERLNKVGRFMNPQDLEAMKSSLQFTEEAKRETLDKVYLEMEEQYVRVMERLNAQNGV